MRSNNNNLRSSRAPVSRNAFGSSWLMASTHLGLHLWDRPTDQKARQRNIQRKYESIQQDMERCFGFQQDRFHILQQKRNLLDLHEVVWVTAECIILQNILFWMAQSILFIGKGFLKNNTAELVTKCYDPEQWQGLNASTATEAALAAICLHIILLYMRFTPASNRFPCLALFHRGPICDRCHAARRRWTSTTTELPIVTLQSWPN